MSAGNLATAADRSWSVGDGTWGIPGNWTPLGVPTPAENAFVGNLPNVFNSTVSMSAPVAVNSLAITSGMRVLNSQRSLVVSGTLSVSGSHTSPDGSFRRSRLEVTSVDGLALTVGNANILNGASLSLDDAVIRANGLLAVGGTGSTIVGTGDVLLYGNGPLAMNLNGSLQPMPGTTSISQIGAGLIDLDGLLDDGGISLNSTVIANGESPDLTISGVQLAGAFDGDIAAIAPAACNTP